MMKIDFHSHILPKMDDGSSGTKESLAMLKILADSGVDTVVLTSHFYRREEGIASFLARRKAAFERLSEAAKESLPACPRLLLGAEVYFYPSLSSDPDFHELCMEGTDYILLELPFERFHDNFYGNYSAFMNRCEQKILLAHIERYLSFGNTPDDFRRLIGYGNTVCQMNCGSIAEAGMFERKKLLGLLESGIVSVLGTDAHNLSARPPLYDKAENVIMKKCGRPVFDRILRRSDALLANAEAPEILHME
ncbi:MAG: hypothetical protein NC084_06110 [Bacteroides sp.]|nr:hypothetical protein [Eubacterium sp.]MCM1418102.1 hypothetical protein [Roseburia sp.]MCM1462274.1 hypothetical protein [Bacteroides sp.]